MLKAENASLKAENLRLQEEVRASKRPNAPFSKGTRKADPKKPGRKPGQGPFVRRAEPVPGPADRVEHLSAPLDATTCPQCGANLEITIAKNRCHNMQRKKTPVTLAVSPDQPDGTSSDPREMACRKERFQALDAALAGLSAEFRAASGWLLLP